MPKIDEDRTSIFLIEEPGKTWTLTRDTHIRIAGTGEAIREEGGLTDTKLVLQGAVVMETSSNAAVVMAGTRSFLHITRTGTITGEQGAAVYGADAVILNEGTIHADGGYGLQAVGPDAKITNAGTLMGSNGLQLWGDSDGSEFINTRDGTISVSQNGILVSVASGSNRIVNHGYIYGGDMAVLGNAGKEIVINRGDMDGDVRLNGGDDVFDTRHGSFDGSVFGGAGDDTYLTSSGPLAIVEAAGEGHDTVKSSFSMALRANIEELVLLGAKNLTAVGNETGCTITGNKGNNIIVGGIAPDGLSGGKGNDRLTGGGGADTFIFRKGFDRDTIADFDAEDSITILGFKTADTYSEVKKLMSDHGDDILITLGGGDTIIVTDVERSELLEGHFNLG